MTGYLRSLFVEERARRHGVASELVERLVAWAEDEHGAVTGSVTAYAQNQDARAVYADLGFETLSGVRPRPHGLGRAALPPARATSREIRPQLGRIRALAGAPGW